MKLGFRIQLVIRTKNKTRQLYYFSHSVSLWEAEHAAPINQIHRGEPTSYFAFTTVGGN